MTKASAPASFSFAAVLFDFDGVLVDTEFLANQIWVELLSEHGLNFSLDEFVARASGQTLSNLYAALERDYGFVRTQSFDDEMTRRVSAAFADLLPLPDAARTLQCLTERGIPFAVASNSEHEHLRPKLAQAGLEDYFGIHAYDPSYVGGRGKPLPDLYRYAAQQLGQDVTQCLVIEDSLPGARAGVAAGATVWGFIGANHITDGQHLLQAGAARLVESHAQLQELLGL